MPTINNVFIVQIFTLVTTAMQINTLQTDIHLMQTVQQWVHQIDASHTNTNYMQNYLNKTMSLMMNGWIGHECSCTMLHSVYSFGNF